MLVIRAVVGIIKTANAKFLRTLHKIRHSIWTIKSLRIAHFCVV